jgi:hypothetical protein
MLLRVKLPIAKFKYGKGQRICTINEITRMNHFKRASLKKEWEKIYNKLIKDAYKAHPFGYHKEDSYRVSLGFKPCKSTKRLDLDGLGWIMKVATDALVGATSIPDDSFRYIVESRIVYLGGLSGDGEEELWLQVEKV